MMRSFPRGPVIAVLLVLLAALVPASAREADPFPVSFGADAGAFTMPSSGGSQQDGSQWDGSQWDGSQWDGSNWDGSNWDGSNWDGSNWDSSRWDGSNWDASQWDASQWDASQWDSAAFTGYDPLYAYQWGLRAANVPGAWELMGPGDGSKVLCVLDSGIDATHPDLATRLWHHPETGAIGHDFVDDDDDPTDMGGHGTHVASIAAGSSGDAYGIAGIARTQIMAVRVIGPDGHGTDEDFALGIRWCVENGADVLSLSMSTVEDVKIVASAVNYAVVHGALVIGSGGNTHCESCQSPLLKLKGVLTITAVDGAGQVAPFATWGPNVDLGAPGVSIPGAFPGERFVLASGTSQAVPHVSGAAILVWQRNPGLTAGDVADVLLASAQRTGSTPYGDLVVLDVEAAVRLADVWGRGALAEAVTTSPSGPMIVADASQVQTPGTVDKQTNPVRRTVGTPETTDADDLAAPSLEPAPGTDTGGLVSSSYALG